MRSATESPWASARTFFPIFIDRLCAELAKTVLVVGASDGKFVLPLARKGLTVTAVDIDSEALLEGEQSLRQRASMQGLADRVNCQHGDIRDMFVGDHDAVWTSCSWHYSRNFDRPLSSFIDALKSHVRPNGIFGAEYMMPVDLRHVEVVHYLEPGEVWGFLPDWTRLWDAYTTVYREEPHPGQPEPHVHRMGFIMAQPPN